MTTWTVVTREPPLGVGQLYAHPDGFEKPSLGFR